MTLIEIIFLKCKGNGLFILFLLPWYIINTQHKLNFGILDQRSRIENKFYANPTLYFLNHKTSENNIQT